MVGQEPLARAQRLGQPCAASSEGVESAAGGWSLLDEREKSGQLFGREKKEGRQHGPSPAVASCGLLSSPASPPFLPTTTSRRRLPRSCPARWGGTSLSPRPAVLRWAFEGSPDQVSLGRRTTLSPESAASIARREREQSLFYAGMELGWATCLARSCFPLPHAMKCVSIELSDRQERAEMAPGERDQADRRTDARWRPLLWPLRRLNSVGRLGEERKKRTAGAGRETMDLLLRSLPSNHHHHALPPSIPHLSSLPQYVLQGCRWRAPCEQGQGPHWPSRAFHPRVPVGQASQRGSSSPFRRALPLATPQPAEGHRASVCGGERGAAWRKRQASGGPCSLPRPGAGSSIISPRASGDDGDGDDGIGSSVRPPAVLPLRRLVPLPRRTSWSISCRLDPVHPPGRARGHGCLLSAAFALRPPSRALSRRLDLNSPAGRTSRRLSDPTC